jgi:hypothetical protein
MVTVVPATVSVPVRVVVAVFAATVNASGPEPVPPGAWSAIHASLPAAVQAHVVADAVTVTWPGPPSAGNEAEVGATVKVQGGGVVGAAAWRIVTVVPATVSVPERAVVAAFGATA